MKVSKNLITDARPFLFNGALDVRKWTYRPGYGVKEFKSCNADVEIFVEGSEYDDKLRYFADVYATARLVRIDGRTLEEYEEEAEVSEVVEILSSILEEGEGYVFPERSFELEDLVFAMILTSLPISSRRESSSLPSGGEGYDCYEEGEEKNDGILILDKDDNEDA